MKRLLAIEQLEPRRLLVGLVPAPALTLTLSGTETVLLDGVEATAAEFSFTGSEGPVNVIVEDLPTQAIPDFYTLDEDTVLIVEAPGVLENDTGITEVELVAGPTHGHAVLSRDGSLIYVPDHNFYGPDYLIYGDGVVWALVTLSVTAASDPPVVIDDFFYMEEDGRVTDDVFDNDYDPDGDVLSVESFTQPENGVVVHDGDGIFTYTPGLDWFGTDQFTYVATDGEGGTGTAMVTIEVSPVNDAPVAAPDSFATQMGEVLGVNSAEGPLFNDVDIDGDALSGFVIVSQPSHGEVTATSTGAFLFRPDQGYVGLDVFSYTISDGALTSEPAIVTITIVDSTLPVVRSDVYLSGPDGITIDAAMGVLANDSDGLTATIVVLPAHGVMVMAADGSFSYTPDIGFVGADPFTYEATDGVFSGRVQSAIWVQESAVMGDMPPPMSDKAVQDVTQATVLGGGSIYDLVAFSQNEAERRAWLDGPILPAAVDAVLIIS